MRQNFLWLLINAKAHAIYFFKNQVQRKYENFLIFLFVSKDWQHMFEYSRRLSSQYLIHNRADLSRYNIRPEVASLYSERTDQFLLTLYLHFVA